MQYILRFKLRTFTFVMRYQQFQPLCAWSFSARNSRTSTRCPEITHRRRCPPLHCMQWRISSPCASSRTTLNEALPEPRIERVAHRLTTRVLIFQATAECGVKSWIPTSRRSSGIVDSAIERSVDNNRSSDTKNKKKITMPLIRQYLKVLPIH